MNPSKSLEIQRIVKLLNLDQTLFARFPEDLLNQKVARALSASLVSYFEWHSRDNCVYLTSYALPYIHETEQSEGRFYPYLKTVFNEDTLLVYLTAIERIATGQSAFETLQVSQYSKLHQTQRIIKYIMFSEQTEEGIMLYGTSEDVTELVTSIAALENSRSTLNQVVNSVPMPIIYVNRDNHLEYANQAFSDVFGIDFDSWKGKHVDAYRHYVDALMKVKEKRVLRKDSANVIHEISAEKNGKRFELVIDEVSIYDQYNQITGRILVHSDVTNRIEDLEKAYKLVQANELLVQIGNLINEKSEIQEIYKAILMGIINVIPKAEAGCVLLLDFNQNLYIKESIGYSQSFVSGFRIPFETSFAKALLNGDYRKSICVNEISKQFGHRFSTINPTRGTELESNITAPINVDGKLYGLISIDSSDTDGFDEIDLNLVDFMRGKIEISINRYKELTAIIEKSQKDELTGLYNRRALYTLVDALINESILCKNIFSLVVLDLDDLKVINDSIGHLSGDRMIKHFADVLVAHTREEDVLARIGGDEFIAIFPLASADEIYSKMAHITDILKRETIEYLGRTIPIEFSYGIAEFPSDGETADHLVEIADQRMYIQKASKKVRGE